MASPISRLSNIWTIRVAIAVLALVLALTLEWLRPDALVRLDEGLRDSFLRLSAQHQAEDRLVVVDIGEEALRALGPWPWPRQRMADLAEILLGNYAARGVGLDMVFPEPGDAHGDARLISLAEHAPLTLAQIFDYTPRQFPNHLGTLAGGKVPPSSQPGVRAEGFMANHAGLAGARCVGNIGYQPDTDGVLRRTPINTDFDGKSYPHFASALLACGQNGGALQPDSFGANGLWRVPYSRNMSAYTVISATDILNESAPRDLIAGRFVLVGSSALGLGDRVSTPLAPVSSGVMVHAASLTGLLDLQAGRLQAPWSGRAVLLAWCVLSIALATFLMARLSAWGGLLLIVGLTLAWLGSAFAGVARQAEWSVTAPFWAYFLLLLVAVPHEWWQAQRRTRQVLNTLSHYVAQPVLDEIVRLNLQHSLKPMLCEVTVLIADMEGYTRATSSLALDEAAELTKDFLGCLTRPVLDGHGTLDKYTGDGLVAFWGAPLPCADQADRAVSAALAILAEVEALNARRQPRGLAPVRVRIGIESGSALVGDLGTSFRSTYTAVGDCINFASRLEAAARDLPTQLVIGSATRRLLRKYDAEGLGAIKLRGTQTTTEVFTVRPD
ncbi:MAG: adenylate/guanylate cyclase domain-containing protein [Polaromonas sp.]|nr:adenylate/guanylate cyclase domain-containing protein [Polaromonas sp.]